jgi:hypothetical protein
VRPRMKLFFAMALVAFVAVNCASSSKDKQGGSKKRASYIPEEISANLLPTMAVGVDECYVFVRPDGDAPFFGPLRKGENIKKIDVGKSPAGSGNTRYTSSIRRFHTRRPFPPNTLPSCTS